MNSPIITDSKENPFLNISQIDMAFPTDTGSFTALKSVDLQIDKGGVYIPYWSFRLR